MTTTVFPARAGMSRCVCSRMRSSFSFPRASGDEPFPMPHLIAAAKFSPRERG